MESLDDLAKAGFCIEEWSRWHQGQCGTYAVALMKLRPGLRLGLVGDLEGPFFNFQHAFAHDDEYAYDAAGRHPLPHYGVHGDFNHCELDQEPSDFDFPSEEGGPEGEAVNIAAAQAHAIRNGILDGRFGSTGKEKT